MTASMQVDATGTKPGANHQGDVFFDRLVTGVTLTCLVALILRVAFYATRPLANADTWFHLRIGHELWGSWSLAHPGALSKFATSPWVPTQWATEMFAAKVEDWFGLPGLAWVFGVLYVVFVVLVYAACRRRADLLVATMVTGVTLIAAAGVLSVRPQVVSLIFFVLTMTRWQSALERGRPPWVLVPLTWAWACSHGLWSAGVVLGLVFCVGALLDAPADRRPWRFLAVPARSLVAAALTPVGPRLLTSQVAVSLRAGFVSEWMPTSFRTPPAFAVAAMAGVLLMFWTRRGRVAWTPLLLLLLAGGWAALVTRMIAFAAVLVAPLLAAELAVFRGRPVTPGQAKAERVTLSIAVLAVLAGTAAVVPVTAQHPAKVPSRFAPRLAALPAGSAVLVEDAVGSWIEYRFPGLSPSVDGMFDAYPLPYLRRTVAAQQVRAGWSSYVRETDPAAAVLDRGSALTAAMQHRLHWREVARDRAWVYLVPPGERS